MPKSRPCTATPKQRGHIELCWSNKDGRLLAGDDGGYEWASPNGPRVQEVRALHDVLTVGEAHSDDRRAQDNLLIRGDALHALTALTGTPEFAAEYRGKVKLVYIDPPYNTGQQFTQYDDALEHSVWLTMFRDRLVQIRDLLADDGTVWVHLDDAEMAYARVIMDEVFGRANFLTTVMWQRRHSRQNDAQFSVSHDYIIVFAKDRSACSINRLPLDAANAKDYANPDGDPRGPWRSISFSAPDPSPNLEYTITAPNGKTHIPPAGRHWRMMESKWHALLADNRAYFGRDGNGVPRIKQFLSEARGLVPNTWWTHTECGHTEESRKEIQRLFPSQTAFATPKPERLLDRIIRLASEPGDIVLDCFAGSGSTAAVAHKMGRRWVTIEWSADTLVHFTEPRLRMVVDGEDLGGVTEQCNWSGGGGFRVLEVGASDSEQLDRAADLRQRILKGLPI